MPHPHLRGHRPVAAGRTPSGRATRLLALALLLVAAGPLAGTAAAHATLIDSTPANDEVVPRAPAEIRLVFDEAVSVDTGGVTVVDPDGKQVQRGAPRSRQAGTEVLQRVGDGPVGTYTVSYRVLSDDGHVISGSYVYHVQQRTGSAGVTETDTGGAGAVGAVGRWIAFSGVVLAAGVVVVAAAVDRGPGGAVDLVSRRGLLVGAGVAALVGTLLALWGSASELAAGSLVDGLGEVPGVVTSGRPGFVLGVRVAAAVVLVVAAAVPGLLSGASWLAAGASVACLLLPSLGGHATTTSPAAVAVLSDAGHLASVAVWIGGLAVIMFTWVADRARLLRFSRLAVVAAPVVVATGALNAWFHTRSLDGLTDTDYGRLVLAKVAGALALVVLGAVHRRWLADAGRSVAAMIAGIRVEVLLGVAVLAVTAVLVGTAPATDTVVQPVERVRQAGDTTVRLDVSPARSGANEVHLYYLSLDGSLAAVDAAELRVSTREVAPRRVPLTTVTASHSVATGVELTPGTWSFALTVVREGVPATTTFEVPIR